MLLSHVLFVTGTGTDNKSHIDDIVHMADDANSGTVALIVISSVTCVLLLISLVSYLFYIGGSNTGFLISVIIFF